MATPVIVRNGENGANYINDTGDNTGKWNAVYCCEDTVFAANCVNNISNFSALVTDATVFAQGQTIYARWTTIDLASGAVIAYKK